MPQHCAEAAVHISAMPGVFEPPLPDATPQLVLKLPAPQSDESAAARRLKSPTRSCASLPGGGGKSAVHAGACSSPSIPNLQMPPYNSGSPSNNVPHVYVGASVAHLSVGAGRASRCCFGDTEHHVDAPKSPVKGHAPLQTPDVHAGQLLVSS